MVESVSYGTYSAAVLIVSLVGIAMIWYVGSSDGDDKQANQLVVRADNQTTLEAVIKDYEAKGYQLEDNAVVMVKVSKPQPEMIPRNATLNLNCTSIQYLLTGTC